MATGTHFLEVGAEHGVVVWAGGGVGESKEHWRNNAPDPLRSGASVRPPGAPSPFTPQLPDKRNPTDADANPSARQSLSPTLVHFFVQLKILLNPVSAMTTP